MMEQTLIISASVTVREYSPWAISSIFSRLKQNMRDYLSTDVQPLLNGWFSLGETKKVLKNLKLNFSGVCFIREGTEFSCFRSVKLCFFTGRVLNCGAFFFFPEKGSKCFWSQLLSAACTHFNLVWIWNNFFAYIFKNTTFTQCCDANHEIQCTALPSEL